MRITREHPPGPSAILGHFGNVGWGLDCAPQQPRPFQLSDPCRTERTPLKNGVRNYTTVSHHQNRTPRGGARTIPAPGRQRQEHRPEFKASLCPLYNETCIQVEKQKQTKPKIPTQVLSHRTSAWAAVEICREREPSAPGSATKPDPAGARSVGRAPKPVPRDVAWARRVAKDDDAGLRRRAGGALASRVAAAPFPLSSGQPRRRFMNGAHVTKHHVTSEERRRRRRILSPVRPGLPSALGPARASAQSPFAPGPDPSTPAPAPRSPGARARPRPSPALARPGPAVW